MSKKLSTLLALIMVATLMLAACGPTAPAEEPMTEEAMTEEAMTEEAMTEEPMAEPFKICQVTDVGGIDDKSFNATVWKGFEQFAADYGAEAKYLESQQQTDYETNINAFIEEGCDFIVTVGYLLGDATYAAAAANPDIPFAIVDFPNADPPYDNVVGMLFATDQAGFLAGYVAASTTQTGKVGTFGGIQIPSVTPFMDGFWYGVKYYNEQKGTNVEILGWDPATQEGLFTGNFESADDGRAFGESLMDEGVDVIMPVAGPVGLGTAAAISERGNAWVIGVDADWKVTAPEYADIVLTSVLKNMDLIVYKLAEDVMNGTFEGGGNYVATLDVNGVGLAGAENFDADLQAELQAIAEGISAGEIQTAP